MLARADHGAVDIGKLARVLRQGARKRGPGIDLGPQRGHQVALAFVVGFFRQCREGALQRQAGRHQPGNLPRPDRQARGAEHGPREQALAEAGRAAIQRLAGLHQLYRQGHQGLGSQQAARGLGGVGLHEALAGLALGVQGFKGKSRHAGAGGMAVAWKSGGHTTG